MDSKEQKPKRCSVMEMVNDCLDAKSCLLDQWTRPTIQGVDQRGNDEMSTTPMLPLTKKTASVQTIVSQEESQGQLKQKHLHVFLDGEFKLSGSVGLKHTKLIRGGHTAGRWYRKLPKLVKELEQQDARLYQLHKQKFENGPTPKLSSPGCSTPACSNSHAVSPRNSRNVTAATVLLSEPLTRNDKEATAPALTPSSSTGKSLFGSFRLHVVRTPTPTVLFQNAQPCTGSIGSAPSYSDIATLSTSIDSSVQSKVADGVKDIDPCVDAMLNTIGNLKLDSFKDNLVMDDVAAEENGKDEGEYQVEDDVARGKIKVEEDDITPRLDLESLSSALSREQHLHTAVSNANELEPTQKTDVSDAQGTSECADEDSFDYDALVDDFFSGTYDKDHTNASVPDYDNEYEEFSNVQLSGLSLASPRSGLEFLIDEQEAAKVESLAEQVLNKQASTTNVKSSDSSSSQLLKCPSNKSGNDSTSSRGSTAKQVVEKQGYCTLADVGDEFELERTRSKSCKYQSKAVLDDVLASEMVDDDFDNPQGLSSAADGGTPMGQAPFGSEIDDACFDAIIEDSIPASSFRQVSCEHMDKDLDAQYDAIVLESKQGTDSLNALAEGSAPCGAECLYKSRGIQESVSENESCNVDSALSSSSSPDVTANANVVVPTFVESPISCLETYTRVKVEKIPQPIASILASFPSVSIDIVGDEASSREPTYRRHQWLGSYDFDEAPISSGASTKEPSAASRFLNKEETSLTTPLIEVKDEAAETSQVEPLAASRCLNKEETSLTSLVDAFADVTSEEKVTNVTTIKADSPKNEEPDAISAMLSAATRGLNEFFGSDDNTSKTSEKTNTDVLEGVTDSTRVERAVDSYLDKDLPIQQPSIHSLDSNSDVAAATKDIDAHVHSNSSSADSMPLLNNVALLSAYTTQVGHALVDAAEHVFGSEEGESTEANTDEIQTSPKVSHDYDKEDQRSALNLGLGSSHDSASVSDEHGNIQQHRKPREITVMPPAKQVTIESSSISSDNAVGIPLSTLDSFDYVNGKDDADTIVTSGSLEQEHELGAETSRGENVEHLNNNLLIIQEATTGAGPTNTQTSVTLSANTHDQIESLDSSFGSVISSQASSAVESIKHTMSTFSKHLDAALGNVQEYPSRLFSGQVSQEILNDEKASQEKKEKSEPKLKGAKNMAKGKTKTKESSSNFWFMEGFF